MADKAGSMTPEELANSWYAMLSARPQGTSVEDALEQTYLEVAAKCEGEVAGYAFIRTVSILSKRVQDSVPEDAKGRKPRPQVQGWYSRKFGV